MLQKSCDPLITEFNLLLLRKLFGDCLSVHHHVVILLCFLWVILPPDGPQEDLVHLLSISWEVQPDHDVIQQALVQDDFGAELNVWWGPLDMDDVIHVVPFLLKDHILEEFQCTGFLAGEEVVEAMTEMHIQVPPKI